MITVLIVLLILALVFGGVGFPRWGYVSASPIVILIIVVLVLWAFGVLR